MFYLVWFFAVLTVIVLIVGLLGFAAGGDFNRKYANKLMRARLLFQFLAVVSFLLIAAILGMR